MSNPLRTSEDYELFLYTLTDQFLSVRRSTVKLIRRGATLARVTGELYFDGDVRLVVRERLIYQVHWGQPLTCDFFFCMVLGTYWMGLWPEH